MGCNNLTALSNGADIKCVLTAEIAGMMGFYLSTRLVIVLFALQCLYLGFGVFGGFRFQGAEALLHEGQIVAQPNRTHAGRRNKHAFFAQFVAGSDLPVCWKGYRKIYNCLFRSLFHAIF